jgi:ubiquinone/menaquinone biosynthesis C-methylase UbiE
MFEEDMNKQLVLIRKAYDLTVEQYKNGIDLLTNLPDDIKNSPSFKTIMRDKDQLNSGAKDIHEYLEPKPGMRLLDAGCCANLANYRLDKWQSIYYGVDISPKLINAMRNFVISKNLSIGGLWVTDITKLPFEDNYFDIATVIGVFEYCTLEYIKESLVELKRVLKPKAKMVLDIPNLEQPDVNVMFKIEEFLDRPNILNSREAFEEILMLLFKIERIDDSLLMIKYFVRPNK